MGHFQRECRSSAKSASPPTVNNAVTPTPNPSANNQARRVAFVASDLKPENSMKWVVDSGCSMHMTPYVDLITGPLKKNEVAVKTASGAILKSIGSGIVTLQLKDSIGAFVPVVFNDVLVIPELKQNLLSVVKLCENGGDVTISGTGSGLCKAGYCFPFERLDSLLILPSYPEIIEYAMKVETLDVWHRRFGHCGFENVRKILQTVNEPFQDSKSDVCATCSTMKLKTIPYPGVSENRSMSPMVQVSVDLVGPMRVQSIDGKHYAMVIVDNHSRVAMVQTLKSKSDAAPSFESVLNLFPTVKVVRSDRGGEFLGRNFEILCNKRGIQREYTSAGAPQQNGIVERKIALLIETARCMIADSRLPEKFWSFALQYAAYCMNRFPTVANEGKSPHELFHKSLPDLSLMRVFGSTCYFKINKQNLSKFEPRGKLGCFIGIPGGTKGFLIYDIETKRVIVSRNVVFDESKSCAVSGITDQNAMADIPINVDAPDVEIPREIPQPNIAAPPAIAPVIQAPVVAPVIEQPNVPPVEQNVVDDVLRTRVGRVVRKPEKYWEVAHLASIDCIDPKSYKDAMTSPNSSDWKLAQVAEIESLEKNGTWSVVPCPMERMIIGSRWVYQTKFNPDGTVNKRKARLVAQGFSQVPGVDYSDVFSPVARLATIRTVISLSAMWKRKLYHIDIKSAYLNAELDEEIFMRPPPGLNLPPDHVLKLHKGLYGLKQAGRNWNHLLSSVLSEFGLIVSDSDPCLYVNMEKGLMVVIYVDDILISCESDNDYLQLKGFLASKFEINDLGKLTWYLGIYIDYSQDSISLSQSLYVDQVVARFRMENAVGFDSPTSGKVLTPAKDESEIVTNVPYRELVGALMWLSVSTRPDIAFAVSSVSRYLDRPTKEHWNAAKRILRYVKGTKDAKLSYICCGSPVFIAYSDADWAGDVPTRKSTSGYVCFLNGTPISWCSKLQKCVALSSAEAEYVAACSAALECVYLRGLLADLSAPQRSATQLFMDNQSAIALSYNPIDHKRTKHIELRVHKIRELVATGDVTLLWVKTDEMLADVFTKPLGPSKHRTFASTLISF